MNRVATNIGCMEDDTKLRLADLFCQIGIHRYRIGDRVRRKGQYLFAVNYFLLDVVLGEHKITLKNIFNT